MRGWTVDSTAHAVSPSGAQVFLAMSGMHVTRVQVHVAEQAHRWLQQCGTSDSDTACSCAWDAVSS